MQFRRTALGTLVSQSSLCPPLKVDLFKEIEPVVQIFLGPVLSQEELSVLAEENFIVFLSCT
jgi:hypothetical protein